MKTGKIFVGLLNLVLMSSAFAQSSVTLSGLIDAGVSYVSNEGGHGNLKFDDGIVVPNLLEFSGREDLGGGTAAIFKLSDQFTLGTGSILAGDSLFSRTAMVGLDSSTAGRLTLGNQYDFMTDSLVFGNDDAAAYASGLYDFRNGPFSKLALPDNPTGAFNWDRMAGDTVENSVKYVSPTYGGFSAGAMYGFGGAAGSIGANNASSLGLNYNRGLFGLNAAYTNVKYDVAGEQDSVRNWGAGAHYKFNQVLATALFTTVHNSANGGGIWQGELGASYQFAATWALSGVYMYMKGNAEVDNDHAHQLTAMLSYDLSKRSFVYIDGVYQRANHGTNALIDGVLDESGGSSNATQLIARVGFQTRF
jgi:predicted porin